MGKTAQGAVWLNADMLSPYEYWQYWRNAEDADVGRFLKIFTDLPLDEIARLEALQGAEINDAKKALATEATALLHGRDEADKAAAPRKPRSSKARAATICRAFPVTTRNSQRPARRRRLRARGLGRVQRRSQTPHRRRRTARER